MLVPSLFFSDPYLSSYSQHSHWSLHTLLQYQAAIVTDAFCSFSLAQKEIASSICVTLAELAVILNAQILHGLSVMPFSKSAAGKPWDLSGCSFHKFLIYSYIQATKLIQLVRDEFTILSMRQISGFVKDLLASIILKDFVLNNLSLTVATACNGR